MLRLQDRISAWKPEGIKLEDAALTAAKSTVNSLIVAGPGAGKTELLAQRASFLLETRLCPPPYRILAISFKRDAAENLKARVLLRCGRELAARLDSLTYDAFAKDIVDRFRLSLPSAICPSADYEVVTGADVSDDRLHAAMLTLPAEVCALTELQRQSIGPRAVRGGIVGEPLPFAGWPKNALHIAGEGMWRMMVASQPSRLMFPMISRLAEYIVRDNQSVRTALRNTYRFVFLDEFQDTTSLQCELTETCFLGSGCVMTAVGDTKQRIMGWAGALPGIFDRFKNNFKAEVTNLTQNHRSRSRLVAVQSVFAAELDPHAVPAVAAKADEKNGECRVLEFANHDSEGAYVAHLVKNLIEKENVPAEEICILCRARPETFAAALVTAIKAEGIRVNIEVNRRETLGEPVSALLLDMLDLILADTAPEAWVSISAIASELAGDDDEDSAGRTRRRLIAFFASQKEKVPSADASEKEIVVFLDACLEFIGRDRFAVRHPQYAHGDYLNEVVESLAVIIEAELEHSPWDTVVSAVRGIGAVSVMTMHKSKGLEFDTVIFLGLEDGSIWNYQKNRDEETCGLFVALSRAKERCIFTFCRTRLDRDGNKRAQSRISIKRVFELFKQSAVEVEKAN